MLSLPAATGAWSGAIALYSIIHLNAADRAVAFTEFARTIRCGGWLLVAFHIDSGEFAAGEVNHVTCWFGKSVDLDGFFLEPAHVARGLEAAGFAVRATTIRDHHTNVEYPSRRCYVLAERL